MSAIEDLIADVDRQWPSPAGRTIDLHIIGASALLLQTDYERATKDGDVLETAALDAPVKTQLLALAGKATALARRHGVYIEPVPLGLPFLPHPPRWHPLRDLNARLSHFNVHVLAIVDVVVSKLLRYSANDSRDIDAMIDGELVDHADFVARMRSAVDVFAHDARAHKLPACVANFHRVERDSFAVEATRIDLPRWLD